MATRDKRKPDRWTAAVPDEKIKPAGSDDCAIRAIERLGPFKHKLCEEAERLGPRVRGVALSEQLAFEQILTLAINYNRQAQLEHGAPRSKAVVERLRKLETLAGELARHLTSLDDITRHRLQTAGTGITDVSKYPPYPLMAEADAAGLPTPAGWDDEASCRWVKRLEALSLYANTTLSMFLCSKGIDSVDLPDKGGNKSLYKDLYGSARWAFVNGGWVVYELFKPNKATGTEWGPFHLFLLDVFEYATGLTEVHSKLTQWLKPVSKANRQMQQLCDEECALIQEQGEIDSPRLKLTLQEREKRHAEVGQKLMALKLKCDDLWPSLFPFSHRPDEPEQASAHGG